MPVALADVTANFVGLPYLDAFYFLSQTLARTDGMCFFRNLGLFYSKKVPTPPKAYHSLLAI